MVNRRSRAVLLPVALSILSGVMGLRADVVINEVLYEPADNTDPGEFIELYNSGASTADLSGWTFSDGVGFTFEAGTLIAAGDYLVIAQDPAFVASTWGAAALGPWSGKLSNEGERIDLRDAAGELADRVEYRIAFPWPLASAGDGDSMQLLQAALDNDLGSSWRPAAPTPGAQNAVHTENAPPGIRQVAHSPRQPDHTLPIRITAKVTDPDGVASVRLLYQIVRPGDYIPATFPLTIRQLLQTPDLPPDPNPAFEDPAGWHEVPMRDDGTEADTTAADDLYTGVIPAQPHRTLVRYRILARDRGVPAASVRAPFADDPSLNFACFVYDGVLPYVPTDRTVHSDGLGVAYPVELMSSIPIYHLITRAEDIEQCIAYSSSSQIPKDNIPASKAFNWEGAFVYDGFVYDHMRYRLRGHNQRYQLRQKRNMRFRFRRGNHFRGRDQQGELYPTRWRSLNFAKMFGPRDVGNYGVTETINSFLFQLVGVDAHFDGALEAWLVIVFAEVVDPDPHARAMGGSNLRGGPVAGVPVEQLRPQAQKEGAHLRVRVGVGWDHLDLLPQRLESEELFRRVVDGDIADHAVPLDRGHHLCRRVALVVDVDLDPPLARRKSLVERRDPFAAPLGSTREAQLANPRERHVRDLARAIGRPIHGRVVHQNESAIGCLTHIGLHVVVPELNGVTDPEQRVLASDEKASLCAALRRKICRGRHRLP